jgi:hypothetical protein
VAYVPPFEHDLFLSYAQEDLDWVSELQGQLTGRLLDRLGEADVWQGEHHLDAAIKWPDAVSSAVRASAAFIAVVSRNYVRSEWCHKELDAFEAQSTGEPVIDGYSRVLKVIKFPLRRDTHEGFLAGVQHIPFFERDAKTGQEREFNPKREPFHRAVDKLAFHIEKLFEAMLLARERVFVALTAGDAKEERDSIIREIRAKGYSLSDPTDWVIQDRLDKCAMKRLLDGTRVSVHLLGREGSPVIQEHIDLARDSCQKVFFCLTEGHEKAEGEHQTLIADIRGNKWNLPDGSWALLQNSNKAKLRQDLIDSLSPPWQLSASRRSTLTNGRADTPRVYLLCDPTSTEDADYAHALQQKIREKEDIDVELPEKPSGFSSPATQHERLLRECDGLLLYYQKASPDWYRRNFADFLMAEDRKRQRELKSKALFLGSDATFPGLMVIQRRDPFNLQQLEPFLAPLRTAYAGS